jgi:hypothetical protein
MDVMAERKHPWIRRVLGVGVLAGAAFAVWRAIEANRPERDVGWEPQPFPFPPQPRSDGDAARRSEQSERSSPGSDRPRAGHPGSQGATETSWVAAADGACPVSHPVKAKLGSGIYHVPGGFSYDRTHADRCYIDAAAAEADGLRASKR